jgi:two-component system chemotaxis response regulator CheB
MPETPNKIRVLVVDDSPAMQQLMKIVLEAESDFELTDIAGSAEQGWGMFCKTPPDIVTLDLELPGRPGLDLLKRIMKERPTPVVIVSANPKEGAFETLNGLESGAVAFIDKPDTVKISLEEFRANLTQTLRHSVAATRGVHRAAGRYETPAVPIVPKGVIQRDRIIAIGASTGGVPAVQTVLMGLASSGLPVVVTQHMPAGYTKRFAERLAQVTGLNVVEANDGDQIEPGMVFIAPGDRHLRVTRGHQGYVCKLHDGAPVSGHKPSVDVMFRSVAEVFGKRAIGVLLTGMGRDGAAGLLEIRQSGGQTLVESEQSAVVFGMPRAALEIGAATISETFAINAIASRVMSLVAPPASAAPPPPATPEEAPLPAGIIAESTRTKPLGAMRVLVVDDQKSMRGLATLCLNQLGFQQIQEVESGEQALQHVGSSPCDLMLLDWNMDGISGLDVVKTLRQKMNNKSTVVVMTTSEKNLKSVHEATVAGANNYLVKPYDKTDLKRRLERALMRTL